MFAEIALMAVLGLVRHDTHELPPRPVPPPEMCMWRWEDREGRFTYTVGPEDDEWEARPAIWEWQLWGGWGWNQRYEFDVKEKIRFSELWRRALEQAHAEPAEPSPCFPGEFPGHGAW